MSNFNHHVHGTAFGRTLCARRVTQRRTGDTDLDLEREGGVRAPRGGERGDRAGGGLREADLDTAGRSRERERGERERDLE